MAIAYNLIPESENAISIHDKDFDQFLNYQIKVTEINFCNSVIVNVDSVFYCSENAKLIFDLPCISIGNYKLEVINSDDDAIIYTFPAIVS